MYYNKNRLTEALNRNNIDAIVASTKENLLYFTGFESVTKVLNPYHSHCYSIIIKDSPDIIHLVLPLGEADQLFDSNAKIGKVKTFGKFFREYEDLIPLNTNEKKLWRLTNGASKNNKPLDMLIEMLIELGLQNATIGLDEDGVSFDTTQIIKKALPRVNFKKASSIIRSVRLIKTSEEINLLRIAARHNENAIQSVINNLYLGISETEMKLIYESSLIEQGSRPALTMMKIGRNAVFGQNRQQENICLRAGDVVWFDSDSTYNGYWSDIARVILYKSQENDLVHKYNALLNGQKTAINEIQHGMTGKEVFNLTVEAVRNNGLNNYRRHHVGHGIGLEPYEKPILSFDSDDYIENGMVISVETPYYEFGLGALHVEDPILITSTGNLQLTLTSSNLEIID